MKLKDADKFFAKINDKYYGTLFFYELYYNDVNNLWLICSACNNAKSDKDVLEWLKEQPFYGQEFLDHIGTVANDGVLIKTEDGRGLAQAATEWFFSEKHGVYAKLQTEFEQRIAAPFNEMNIKLGKVIEKEKNEREKQKSNRAQQAP